MHDLNALVSACVELYQRNNQAITFTAAADLLPLAKKSNQMHSWIL